MELGVLSRVGCFGKNSRLLMLGSSASALRIRVSIMQNNTNFLYTSSMPYNPFTLPLLTQNVQHQNFRSLRNALLPGLSDPT